MVMIYQIHLKKSITIGIQIYKAIMIIKTFMKNTLA